MEISMNNRPRRIVSLNKVTFIYFFFYPTSILKCSRKFNAILLRIVCKLLFFIHFTMFSIVLARDNSIKFLNKVKKLEILLLLKIIKIK